MIKVLKTVTIYNLIKSGACETGVSDLHHIFKNYAVDATLTEDMLNDNLDRLKGITDCIGFLVRHAYIKEESNWVCSTNDDIVYVGLDRTTAAVLLKQDKFARVPNSWRWRLFNRPQDTSYNYPNAHKTVACADLAVRFGYKVYECTQEGVFSLLQAWKQSNMGRTSMPVASTSGYSEVSDKLKTFMDKRK